MSLSDGPTIITKIVVVASELPRAIVDFICKIRGGGVVRVPTHCQIAGIAPAGGNQAFLLLQRNDHDLRVNSVGLAVVEMRCAAVFPPLE